MTTTDFSQLKSVIFLIACSLFIHHSIFAQAIASPTGFQHQIGVDLSMPLHGYLGASVLYKHQIGSAETRKWQHNQALRGLVGLYREDLASVAQYVGGDSTVTINFNGQNKAVFIHGGWEFQATKKRFQFYYGGDLGFRYIKSTSQSMYEINFNGTNLTPFIAEGVSNTKIPQVSVFGGLNYFFTPHFSLGLEISIPAALEYTSSETVYPTSTRSDNYLVVAIGGDYFPRLLYLSWHFGQKEKNEKTGNTSTKH